MSRLGLIEVSAKKLIYEKDTSSWLAKQRKKAV